MQQKKYYPDLISRCEECKRKDFVDYLLQHEHFTVSEKSTRKYPVLKDPLNGYHYLIKKNPRNSSQYQCYITEDVNPDGSTNFSKRHFTLVDYIMQKYRLELGEAVEHIESKSGTSLPISNWQAPVSSKPKPKKYSADSTLLMPYSDLTYLTEIRKIQSSIVLEPFLKKALRQIAFSRYTNTVFPMKNMEGKILNWCEKNAIPQKNGNLKSWNSFPEGTTNGLLFISDPPPFTKYILFSEAPIDAISYYQINHSILKDSCLIVSSCGNINSDMLVHLNKIMDRYPDAKLAVANDFDAAGFRFDFMIASACGGRFSTSDSIKPFFHPIKTSNDGESFFKCSFISNNPESIENYHRSLSLYANNKLLSFSFSPIEATKEHNEIQHLFQLQFSFNLRHSKLLLDHYCDYFQLHRHILFDKPSRGFRDWNETLGSGNFYPSDNLKTFSNPRDSQLHLSGVEQDIKKKMIKR